MLNISKAEYAINREMLRAVLNGYFVDMNVQCTLNMQKKDYSEKLK